MRIYTKILYPHLDYTLTANKIRFLSTVRMGSLWISIL